MTQVTWYLHSDILARLTYHSQSFPASIEAAGHNVVLVPWKPGQRLPNIPFKTEPTVLFGSHPFIKEVYATVNPALVQPGALGVNDRTRASAYMSNLPLEWFLNREGVFMTWAMFKQRAKGLFYEHNTDKLFVRPDSGFKTFAGQILNYGTIEFDIETLDKLSGVMPETMVLVNPPQKLKGEFRFVIADGRVVTASEYRWDDKLDVRRDWPAECEALAQQVADHEWQIDIAYTCDVALLEDGVKLVELNGFSCAGLYACDLDKVVPAVSAAAFREFNGDDDVAI